MIGASLKNAAHQSSMEHQFVVTHKKESQKMTKPSEIKVQNENAPAKKKPSTPVRNPAFREHEGLRELQRKLNSNNRRPTPRKNK